MNSGAPYFYDYINAETSQVTPSTIHVRNTALSAFFRRYLFQKAMSVFKWNLPENWEENYSSLNKFSHKSGLPIQYSNLFTIF